LTEIKRALLLARKSNAPAEASTAQKTDAAVIALSEATQILAPSASGGSPTPAPAPQSVTTLALKEVLENNVTAAKNALAEKNSAQPERVIQQLTTFATAAADKGQPELASLAKESIGRIQKEAARTQETRVSETAAHAASNITENIKEAQKKLHPRVYIHIAGENQRSGAETLRDKLSDAGFQVPGIQNVAGRGYIPDTIEVRRFQTDSPTQQSAEAILHLVQATFLRSKSRISYVLPDASSDRPGHFEIWLSREAAAPAAAR
jgi:hypothetical protein